MDTVVYKALEEICSQGPDGLTLSNLWFKINHHLTANGIPLSTNVKQALWSNLVNIPSIRFECKGVPYDAQNPNIQSVEHSESMDLKIVAAEHLLNNFLGIYDIKASDAGISENQERILKRLAIARTDGVTQSELAKELNIESNNIFYPLKHLEARGLIVRQSTLMRTKEAGNDEYKNGSIVNTNMLHLYRYAKHLGHSQRIEITKEDKAVSSNKDNADGEVVTEQRIKDYVPAIRAICDRLEKADGKVVVIPDIKKELGYRKSPGHRAWRNILHRMKDACLVEDFFATVNNKVVELYSSVLSDKNVLPAEVRCLRLLKTFSSKTDGTEDDDADPEQQVKKVKRGQLTEQLMELPIDQQIYDMIDAQGSKGLILTEVCKRLGINNKQCSSHIDDMVSRYGMHRVKEILDRNEVRRVWTRGNYKYTGVSKTTAGKEDTISGKSSTAGKQMLPPTIQDIDDSVSSEEQNVTDTSLDPISLNNQQCETSGVIISKAATQTVCSNPVSTFVPLELSSSASQAPRSRHSRITYPCLGLNTTNSQKEQRILEKLQEEKVLIRPKLQRLLERLEKYGNKHMDRKTLVRCLNKLQENGHCKCICFNVPLVTNCDRKRKVDVILHPSVYEAKDLSELVHDKWRSFEKESCRQNKSFDKESHRQKKSSYEKELRGKSSARYKKCEKITENLNLTFKQDKMKIATSAKEQKKLQSRTPASLLSNKRKIRHLKENSVNDENSLAQESHKLKRAKMSSTEDALLEQNSVHERHITVNEKDAQKEAVDDDLELVEDDNTHYSTFRDSALSNIPSSHKKSFVWTRNKDRQLVIEYVKHRAALGAKFHHTAWASLQSLPGPPYACKRRMSNLNKNKQFKEIVMRICNLLSVRYSKHLQHSQKKSPAGENFRLVIEQNAHAVIDHTNDFDIEKRWDDFENKDIKMLLDDALKYTQLAKSEVTKGAQDISKYTQSQELDENNMGSSSSPINELKKDGSGSQASTRRSRRPLPESYAMLMNKVKGFGTHAYKSLAVSNAMELFKLVFLNTAKTPEVPNMLAETLRRYSEPDLLTSFNYLRDRNFMVRGNGNSHFVLSQQFLYNISSSPFPVNTGKRAVKMSRWLHERQNELLDTGVHLSADDLQCGDVLQLSVLMVSEKISVFPCLPDEGVGTFVDMKKRKCVNNEDCSVEITKRPKLMDRKEKGFPGIQLSLSCGTVSSVDATTLSGDENAITYSFSLEHNSAAPCVHLEHTASESTWEAMTSYARHLEESYSQEPSMLCPNLFKTMYSAIQKAGDQGLSMEEIFHITDLNGENIPELIVEVLEAFGHAFKVNAYDSVRVVDSLYRSKYSLTSMGSHQHDLDAKVPERSSNEGELLELQQECPKNNDKKLVGETCTDLELHKSSDEVHHRVTNLHHRQEISHPMREVESNHELETYTIEKVMSPRTGPQENMCESHDGDIFSSYKPIFPWVNGDGTINELVYKALVRRVLGIVMQNPGILEGQMNALNPQSCRKLLELMILDGHIRVRKMYQSISSGPPPLLNRLLGCNLEKPKLVCKHHLYANLKSVSYL